MSRRLIALITLLGALGLVASGCDTKDAVATVTARAAGTATAIATLTGTAPATQSAAPAEATTAAPPPAQPTAAPPATAAPTQAATQAAVTKAAATQVATQAAASPVTQAATAAPTSAATQAASTPAPATAPATTAPTQNANQANTAWFRDSILYSVFVRSFRDSNGDGIGDLQGVIDGLDYIQSLGAGTIWLLPVFKAGSYHGYDTIDYYTVNPDYGTNDDLVRLIKEVHKRKMHILLDYVVNHTSNQHPFFKDAFKNLGSKYTEFYTWMNDAHSQYKGFANLDSMPMLNFDSQAVWKYLTDVAVYWMDPNKDGDLSDGIDGWRCDVATGPPHEFWAQIRAAMTAKNPNSVMLGELWTTAPQIKKYFTGNEFDAAFDFPAFNILSGSGDANGDGVLAGRNGGSFFSMILGSEPSLYPAWADMVKFVNSHDTNRVMGDVNGDMARARAAALLLMTMPGTPMLYYGEEIGMQGNKGPGNPYYDEFRREPLDWYKAETGKGMTTWFKPTNRFNKPDDGISVEEEDDKPLSLLTFYRTLGKLRNDSPALYGPNFDLPQLSGDQSDLYLIRRWDGNSLYLIVINFSIKPLPWALAPAFLTAGGQTYKLAGDPIQSDLIQKKDDGSSVIQPAGYAVYKASK